MIAVLEVAWAAIQSRHPQVPAVVIVLGAGSGRGPGLTLGHFAAMRWNDPEQVGDGVRLPEVFVGGEGLSRGPADVLATLLHEAAHAVAHVRGIKDTSRQGRWHNARFKAIAEELGVEVTKDDRIGWSPTTLLASTRETYAAAIDELGRTLRLHRSIEVGRPATKATPTPPVVCGCGRAIRIGRRRSWTGRSCAGSAGRSLRPNARRTR
jgi:hypothetical protein